MLIISPQGSSFLVYLNTMMGDGRKVFNPSSPQTPFQGVKKIFYGEPFNRRIHYGLSPLFHTIPVPEDFKNQYLPLAANPHPSSTTVIQN
jgi:hypothetical protein